MTTQPNSRLHTPLYLPVTYLLAASLCLYAFGTFTATPLGILNFCTLLITAGLGAGTVRLAHTSFSLWTAACVWTTQRGVRLPPLLLAIGLGLLTAIRFSMRLSIGGDFASTTVILWVCAWSALLAATWPHDSLGRWIATCRNHRIEIACVVLLAGVAALLRFYQLGSLPNAINGDEGLIGMWALAMGKASGILTTPFAAMDGVGTNYLYVMNGVFQVWGASPFTLRLLPAIAGTLALPVNYVCARALLGRRAAWVAVLVLLVSHVHIHFSHTVAVSYIYATLFVPLTLYLLLSGLEQRSPFRLALAALAVGLHITIYVDGWAWLVLQGILVAGWAVVDRSLLRGNRFNLLIWIASLAIIIAPMVVWGVHFPDEFFSRTSGDGMVASGWLAREMEATGQSAPAIVLNLLLLAITTFNDRPFTDFYQVGVPTLDAISRIFWGYGLLLALIGTWNRRMLVLNGWFWGGVVALGVMTIPITAYSYRLLVSLPAACMLVGLAIDSLLRLIERTTKLPTSTLRPITTGAIVLLIAGIAYLNLTTYFNQFANACTYVQTPGRLANTLGTYLGRVPRNTQAIVLPTENSFSYGPHRSVEFLSGSLPITNIYEPLTKIPPATLALAPGQGLIVAALPERKQELSNVSKWLPGGGYVTLRDCGTTPLYLYTWKPQER